MAIIEVNHVTKEYRLGQMQSLKQSVQRALARLRGNQVIERTLFKALDDVDFTVEKGEVLGIIGENGAGKSTLLKMLAAITTPTHGNVKVRGTVAPLIEVGAGLIPDFTGRENIYLNAAILGMKRTEIKRKFDEIVAFADLAEFIDTPTKRYSSGMQVRLGFSIATSVDADILIVDEVLAVGDLAFQRKCFDRMEGMIRRQGKTVLLVSHNVRQVERVCSRVLMLDQGKIFADGNPAKVCALFCEHSNDKILAFASSQLGARARIRSSGEAELVHVDVLDESGRSTDKIVSGGVLRIRVVFSLSRLIKKPEIVVGTHTTDFVYLSASSTAVFDARPDFKAGIHEVEYIVPSFPLTAGLYLIRFAIFDQYRRIILAAEGIKMFHVIPLNAELHADGYQAPDRALNLDTEWMIAGTKYREGAGIGLSDTDVRQ